jgi:hypothetical protein
MTDPPMKTPRRRPPGFADPSQRLPDGVIARPAHAAEEATADVEQPPPSPPALAVAATPPAQPKSKPRRPTPEVPRDPYAGAASRQVNTRLLEPLHSRYMQLVRELGDEGYPTSFTEILHALLDDGPTTADDAREIVRAWRRRREP